MAQQPVQVSPARSRPAHQPPTPPRYPRLVRPLVLVVFALSTLAGCRNRGAAQPQPPESPQPAASIDTPEITTFVAEPPEAPPLVIDFLNAGQGDCIHIACPNGNSIVVDCGSNGKDDDELEAILAALVLPAPEVRVVVTHQDSDHYNKLPAALSAASADNKIKAVYVGGPHEWLPKPDPDSRSDSKKIAAWLDRHGATYPAPDFDGRELACGEDVSIEVLLAGHDTKLGEPLKSGHNKRKNNASIVLKLERGDFGIMLAGDAYDTAEKVIIAKGKDLEAEVLKLGHHGAEGSTSMAWIEEVRPIHLITTAGHHRSHGHPRCAVLDRFKDEPGKATKLRPLEEAPTHAVECSVAKGEDPWKRRDLSVSVWNSCESGHLRLTVPAEGKPTLRPHIFAQDKAGKAGGKDCPVRFEK